MPRDLTACAAPDPGGVLTLATSKPDHTLGETAKGREPMGQLQKTGFPLLGAIFLALGVFRLVQGDSWVVWIILGVLFGGLGLFSRRK